MLELLMEIRADQRQQWESGNRVPAEAYLDRHPAVRSDDEASIDVIVSEILLRKELGEEPDCQEYLERFPRFGDQLRREFNMEERLPSCARRVEDPPPVEPSHCRQRKPMHGTRPVGGFEPGGVPELPGYDILGRLEAVAADSASVYQRGSSVASPHDRAGKCRSQGGSDTRGCIGAA